MQEERNTLFQISIQITKEDFLELQAACQEKGLSIGEWIKVQLDQKTEPRADASGQISLF